jgi:hypothetical protein
MLSNAPEMDQSDTGRAREAALARARDSRLGLSDAVELYGIYVRPVTNYRVWDVWKRRLVTAIELVGTHPLDSRQHQHCARCAVIRGALRDLVLPALPPQGDCCQHTIAAVRTEDDLSTREHRITLPVILIHRTAAHADDSPGRKCVAEFRSHLQWFGVCEPIYEATADRSRE